ncbi:MAG TPA: hypothetical protein PLL69_05275 [Gemmatimonadales bacterium]|nr:hypothetical protein [Gemmatimonadales bacterium]
MIAIQAWLPEFSGLVMIWAALIAVGERAAAISAAQSWRGTVPGAGCRLNAPCT